MVDTVGPDGSSSGGPNRTSGGAFAAIGGEDVTTSVSAGWEGLSCEAGEEIADTTAAAHISQSDIRRQLLDSGGPPGGRAQFYNLVGHASHGGQPAIYVQAWLDDDCVLNRATHSWAGARGLGLPVRHEAPNACARTTS